MREKSSIEFLKKSFKKLNVNNINITSNIDPVFLLTKDEWVSILLEPMNRQKEFIFKYINQKEDFIELNDNGKIIYSCRLNSPRIQNDNMPDPREWLWYLFNAEKVVTSSFHGFAFSVLFNRKVECDYSNNYRIKELISLLNIKLENGIIVNYDEVMKNIEYERQRSFDYLSKAISSFKRKEYCSYSRTSRNRSTSGGTTAELARYIFNNNGIVYGAAYSSDFKSVNIIPVENIDDYYKHIARSKYSFSQLPKFKDVEDILKTGRFVMFTGLPCQIKALKLYLKIDYENLLTVELLCSGISSNQKLRDLVEKIEKENNSKVVQFDMRYNHRANYAYTLENGKSTIMNNIDSYQYFINTCRLDNCKKCKMHFGSGFADITIGDFWDHYNNGRVKDKSFSPIIGTNIVYVNSEKADNIFNQIDTVKKQI